MSNLYSLRALIFIVNCTDKCKVIIKVLNFFNYVVIRFMTEISQMSLFQISLNSGTCMFRYQNRLLCGCKYLKTCDYILQVYLFIFIFVIHPCDFLLKAFEINKCNTDVLS